MNSKTGLFEKTSVLKTAIGLPKNLIWIGLLVLIGIMAYIIRQYQLNALKVNELTQEYVNTI
jgi:hypothetical protein